VQALPENVDRQPSKAFTDTGDTAIGSAIAKETSDHPGQSGFLLLENGLDAFVARAVLARFAERSIDVSIICTTTTWWGDCSPINWSRRPTAAFVCGCW
jgi:phosphatidylserine/phosphatidylglycerophosphate/cardiolipin synthase-like enzyme